uniref:Uncharacterized protein n=1 Tax=Lepeophtheirus salmonis TaxID=72036 RepID=A0A0K2TPL9_LEPSM
MSKMIMTSDKDKKIHSVNYQFQMHRPAKKYIQFTSLTLYQFLECT